MPCSTPPRPGQGRHTRRKVVCDTGRPTQSPIFREWKQARTLTVSEIEAKEESSAETKLIKTLPKTTPKTTRKKKKILPRTLLLLTVSPCLSCLAACVDFSSVCGLVKMLKLISLFQLVLSLSLARRRLEESEETQVNKLTKGKQQKGEKAKAFAPRAIRGCALLQIFPILNSRI